MGCHGNHAFSHSPNLNSLEDNYVSHPGGPNEQFGTHETLSYGMQCNLNDDTGVYVKMLYPSVIHYFLYDGKSSFEARYSLENKKIHLIFEANGLKYDVCYAVITCWLA